MAPSLQAKRKPSTTADRTIDDSATKRAKLLEDDDSSSEAEDQPLKINEDYAKRFKHNKERAELHRLEEKYGPNGDKESDETSSEEETEDEDGELLDEKMDAEIAATLEAIRSKDPRIYSKDTKFYTEPELAQEAEKTGQDKPMYLRDYHRKNLLDNGGQVDEDEPMTYVQEQANLKRTLVEDIHAAGNGEEEDGSDDDFLVRKEKKPISTVAARPPIPDPRTADEDPSTFLSNFFASRAWVPTERTQFHPLESDDENEDAKAEALEHAWNLRFEDPENSNKTLTSHSREIVAKYSVRRDDLSGRKKVRENKKEKKLREKTERDAERKRFKKLKVRQMEEKMEKIREAAGIRGKKIEIDEWTDLLEGDWKNEEWNKEMSRRFGEEYYQEDDEAFKQDDGGSKKPRKPRWDDDIDVKDLDPDFEDEEEVPEEVLTEEEIIGKTKVATEKVQKAKDKAAARRDRRIIETIAEQSLPLSLDSSSSKDFQPFRYRETSPNTFGLTALDILAADDAQLNEFAGLKKLATFRDPEWKKNDKKKLSKKARLRAWRKDTFGREEGPDINSIVAPGALNPVKEDFNTMDGVEVDVKESSNSASKRKRKRKSKGVIES
jgi:protein KRI1